MTSITRTERLNRKLFASVICGLFVCCFSLLLIIERNFTKKITGMEMVPESSTTNSHQACFQRTIHRHKNAYEIRYLEDVLETDRKPKAGESIIFHKTTCSRSGLVHLNSRQSCAIESAAKLNPERDVFVLFASPVGYRENVTNLPANIELLKSYSNIHLFNNNVWKYAENTPLEKWLHTGALFESNYLFERMSDVLRYLTLYKFGGIVMDLDVIVQQNFDHLGHNFAGDESVDDLVGCDVINFGYDKVGRKIAERCIRLMIDLFNSKTFTANGSFIITRTLEKMCKTKIRSLMTREQCDGFQLYPKSMFYAVSWKDWKWFYNPSMANHTLALTENSTVIRVWDDLSKKTKVKIGTHTAYEMVAKKNCPKIFQSRINYEYF